MFKEKVKNPIYNVYRSLFLAVLNNSNNEPTNPNITYCYTISRSSTLEHYYSYTRLSAFADLTRFKRGFRICLKKK